MLQVRGLKIGADRFVYRPVFDVTDDPDDFSGDIWRIRREADALADRILARPKAARPSQVNCGDARSARPVRDREGTPIQERDAERPEMIRRNIMAPDHRGRTRR